MVARMPTDTPASQPPLGAHVSIAGGLAKAIERGCESGCEAIQIFVKNNNQWVGRTLDDAEAEAFRVAREASAIGPVVAHASYLINLAATDPTTLERSLRALADELVRCRRLGLDGLVLHPGAHVGAGTEAGIAQVGRSLDAVFAEVDSSPPLLLENTAGQGTVLGAPLEELARIVDATRVPQRLGFCLDTCHAYAAGYDLAKPQAYEAFVARFDELLGLDALGAIHLNDSKQPLGSHRDRHANLGRGEMGLEAFAQLVRDPRLAEVPMIVETPRGEEGAGHRTDLESLRHLREMREMR